MRRITRAELNAIIDLPHCTGALAKDGKYCAVGKIPMILTETTPEELLENRRHQLQFGTQVSPSYYEKVEKVWSLFNKRLWSEVIGQNDVFGNHKFAIEMLVNGLKEIGLLEVIENNQPEFEDDTIEIEPPTEEEIAAMVV